MSNDKQTQKAGDNSSLVQAGIINVYNGITEERAREITAEFIPEILKQCSEEARAIADQRINRFVETFVCKLVKMDLLESFLLVTFQHSTSL